MNRKQDHTLIALGCAQLLDLCERFKLLELALMQIVEGSENAPGGSLASDLGALASQALRLEKERRA